MSLAGKRVLVVEDEALIALDTIAVLEDAGCVVTGPETSVEAALKRIAQGGVDAAVLDVNLKGSYVWPVAQQLQSIRVPFIFVTGYGTVLECPAEFSKVRRLDKPIDRDRFLQAVASL